LLDNLHAKFYIGNKIAILGSSNLSRNGIDANGLEEASLKIEDNSLLSELSKYFIELKNKANNQYGNPKSKIDKVCELIKNRNKAGRSGLIAVQDNSPTLSNYKPLSDKDFYIVYHIHDEAIFTDEANKIRDLIEDSMNVSEKDDIEEGKWILTWAASDNCSPILEWHIQGQENVQDPPRWIYIDRIIKNGVVAEGQDKDYPKLAIQLKNKNKPPFPFELDDRAISSFIETMRIQKFIDIFTDNKVEVFSVNTAFKNNNFQKFITEMKKIYEKKTKIRE